MISILSFLASGLGRYVVGGLGIVALIVAFSVQQQHKGAAKAVAKIEKKDAANVSKSGSAARRSRDPAAHCVLDPNVRSDD